MTISSLRPPHTGSPERWHSVPVTGDLDLATGPALDARLTRAISRHPDDGLLLDLRAVPFMDCAGMHPLLRARNRLAHLFCLRGLQPRVTRLLSLAGVADSLPTLTDTFTETTPPDRAPMIDLLTSRRRPSRRSHAVNSAAGLGSFVGLLSVSGTLVEANRTTHRTGFLRGGKVTGFPFWESSWWSWSEIVQARLKDAVDLAAAGEVVRYDETLLSEEGHLLTVDLAMVPLLREGTVTAVIASISDLAGTRF